MAARKGRRPEKSRQPEDGRAGEPVWPAPPPSGVAEGVAVQWLSPQVSASFSVPGPEPAPPPARAAILAFRQLASLWNLGMADQLTLLGLRATQKATYYRWLRQAQAGSPGLQLDRDQMARIGHLLAIFEALGHLFQVAGQADAWVHQPNPHPLFQGGHPLERLLRGGMEDLIAVRAYAEAAREGSA